MRNKLDKNKKRIWDDCTCGFPGSERTTHTSECKRNHRKNYLNKIHRDQRKERKEKHLCANCGGKVTPKVIIPYRCDSCQSKIIKYLKGRKEKQNE